MINANARELETAEAAVAVLNSEMRIAATAQERIEEAHYFGEQQGSYP